MLYYCNIICYTLINRFKENKIMSFNQYDDNKVEDCIYLGQVKDKNGKKYRHAELLFNMDETFLENANSDDTISAKITNSVLLHKTSGGQQKVYCWIEEYGNGQSSTSGLRICRRAKKGVCGEQEICLNSESIIKLKKFLDTIFAVDFNKTAKYKIDINKYLKDNLDIKSIEVSQHDFENILSYNIAHLENYTKIFEIKKREEAVKRLEEIIKNETSYKNEIEINKFLKNNLWMFNNEYVFFSENNVINPQNILDLVPTTFDGYIDIIELKLPTVKIFNYDKSHKNYYPSHELNKAIAQCMNYILECEKAFANNPTYLKTKANIIIGNICDLSIEEAQFLRVLNSFYHNIKIYTYQNLLEKAKNSLDFIKNYPKKD